MTADYLDGTNEVHRDHVFLNDKNEPFRDDGGAITHAFERLRKKANAEHFVNGSAKKQKTLLKLCRNIGSSLGRKGKRPLEEREMLLGHKLQGTGPEFYDDESILDPSYLVKSVVGRKSTRTSAPYGKTRPSHQKARKWEPVN